MSHGKSNATNQFDCDRRKFVVSAGSAIALGVLPDTLLARSQLSAPKRTHVNFEHTVVVHSINDQASFTFAKTLSDYGAISLELAQDPFQTWCNSLSQLMEINKEFRLMGLTSWSDYLLLKGLAAELRRYPLREQQHWLKTAKAQQWVEKQAKRLANTGLDQSEFENDSFFSEPISVNNKHGYGSYLSWIIS